MKEDWDRAINFVLAYEGGQYENNPADPGGETKWGISKKAYPNLDIASITVEQAQEIYRKDFWTACACDDLPSALAIAVFDAAVNQGVGVAKRMLQMSLGVEVDGVLGPQTLAAAAKSGPTQIQRFLARRLERYVRIIVKNPALETWTYNWSYRVLKLADLVAPQPSL